jgi:signal recognition particle GTPase
MAGEYTIDALQAQLTQLEKMPWDVDMLRRAGFPDLFGEEDRHAVVERVGRIIAAMSPEQRRAPEGIDRPQVAGIAAASGASEEQVAHFLLQFLRTRNILQQLARMNFWQRLKLVLGWGQLPPAGQGPAEPGGGVRC